MSKQATLYRMVMPDHLCPFGLKSKHLLEREGYEIDDNHLTTREEVDAVKEKFNVDTTPQTVIDGERIGGYDDLKVFFGKETKKEQSSEQTTYQPIIAVFGTTALMALAAAWFASDSVSSLKSLVWFMEWFIAFSMCVLGILKLRDLSAFTNQFISYDLLARKDVRYGYFYPFGETGAGILMLAGGLFGLIAAPIALFIGSVGAWSVFKAVYLEKRDLKCACVGGDSNVPLGIISLTENVMMVLMAIWIIFKLMA